MAKSVVPSSGKIYFEEIARICFLTSLTNSLPAFSRSDFSSALFILWKFSIGNLLSIGKIPASVLMAASTLSPEVNWYCRKNELCGIIWAIRSLRTCSPIFPRNFGLFKNSCSSFIDLPISEKLPASRFNSPITSAALVNRSWMS